MSIQEAVSREIKELHCFFEEWLSGQLPATTAAFARFTQVMAAEFTIVGPDGRETELIVLAPGLQAAWGTRPGLRIWIEGVRLLWRQPPLVVASYEEWQSVGPDKTGRISTVIFREAPDTPNSLTWLRVHETWRSK